MESCRRSQRCPCDFPPRSSRSCPRMELPFLPSAAALGTAPRAAPRNAPISASQHCCRPSLAASSPASHTPQPRSPAALPPTPRWPLSARPSDVAEREQCDVLSVPARRHQNPAAQQKDTLTAREKGAHTSPALGAGTAASQRRFPVPGPVTAVRPRGCSNHPPGPGVGLGACPSPPARHTEPLGAAGARDGLSARGGTSAGNGGRPSPSRAGREGGG